MSSKEIQKENGGENAGFSLGLTDRRGRRPFTRTFPFSPGKDGRDLPRREFSYFTNETSRASSRPMRSKAGGVSRESQSVRKRTGESERGSLFESVNVFYLQPGGLRPVVSRQGDLDRDARSLLTKMLRREDLSRTSKERMYERGRSVAA